MHLSAGKGEEGLEGRVREGGEGRERKDRRVREKGGEDGWKGRERGVRVV